MVEGSDMTLSVDVLRDHQLVVDAEPSKRRHVLQSGDALRLLERMLEIRVVEERVQQLFFQGMIAGTTHTCQGQEAVCVGVASVVPVSDVVLCTYRGHGWAMAMGMSAETVVSEIMGRRAGCVGGLGGSMHLNDRALGFWPTNAIVGAQLPIATGVGLESQVRGSGRVAIAVFGDGAANIGAFHEALNLAALWKLPVVFLCENNLYGEYSRMDLTTSVVDVAQRASAYDMPGVVLDGQDVFEVRRVVADAVDRARSGGGPTLLEAKTYRFVGHSRADAAKYRPEGELERWLERDPVKLLAQSIVPGTDELIAEIRARCEAAVAPVVERVLTAPIPDERDLFTHIYAAQEE
jgi:acetoin:2,6-dichlorophenolindophenol oxidoreductase subunit alpha